VVGEEARESSQDLSPTRATAPRPAIASSAVATGRGDDGSTGLLYGGPRISKDDPRTEAYGTVDEAVAALGLARAELGLKAQYGALPPALGGLGELLLQLQRDLFVVGSELASNPEAWSRLVDGVTRVDEPMVERLEVTMAELEDHIAMPTEFVVPGETRLSAALELARTIVRRAERRTVGLAANGMVAGSWLLPYLNRLADLLWVVARAAEQGEQRGSIPARPGRRAAARGPRSPAPG